LIFRNKADITHPIHVIAEEQDEQISESAQLVTHGFQSQVHSVLWTMPEGADKLIQCSIHGCNRGRIPNHIIGDDGDNTPGDRVLAPGGLRILIDILNWARS
jgi:hypothetical protein